MDLGIKNKKVLVIGGSTGIGAQAALSLSKEKAISTKKNISIKEAEQIIMEQNNESKKVIATKPKVQKTITKKPSKTKKVSKK